MAGSTRKESMADNGLILDKLHEVREWQNAHETLERVQYAKIEVHMATTNQQLDKLASIEEKLVGNGHPGLLTRTDRLERTLAVYTWIISGLGAATLALTGRLVFTFITGK